MNTDGPIKNIGFWVFLMASAATVVSLFFVSGWKAFALLGLLLILVTAEILRRR